MLNADSLAMWIFHQAFDYRKQDCVSLNTYGQLPYYGSNCVISLCVGFVLI